MILLKLIIIFKKKKKKNWKFFLKDKVSEIIKHYLTPYTASDKLPIFTP